MDEKLSVSPLKQPERFRLPAAAVAASVLTAPAVTLLRVCQEKGNETRKQGRRSVLLISVAR